MIVVVIMVVVMVVVVVVMPMIMVVVMTVMVVIMIVFVGGKQRFPTDLLVVHGRKLKQEVHDLLLEDRRAQSR